MFSDFSVASVSPTPSGDEPNGDTPKEANGEITKVDVTAENTNDAG